MNWRSDGGGPKGSDGDLIERLGPLTRRPDSQAQKEGSRQPQHFAAAHAAEAANEPAPQRPEEERGDRVANRSPMTVLAPLRLRRIEPTSSEWSVTSTSLYAPNTGSPKPWRQSPPMPRRGRLR
jgi:hypothetical protein